MKPTLEFMRWCQFLWLHFGDNLTGTCVHANSGFGEHMNNPASEWLRGKGPIPAGKYEVATIPHLSQKAGGNFYHITPDPYYNPADHTQQRCELGIHADKPPKGSNGCIVLDEEQFPYFEALMAAARAQGHETLELTVS